MHKNPSYLGCHWRNGTWAHVWSDGSTLPVLRGRDESGSKKKEGEEGGTGGGNEDEDEEDDDDDDDNDDVDTSKIKDPVAKAVADAEAAARHKWKKRVEKARQEERDRLAAEAEQAKKPELEKEKARADAAEKERDELKGHLDTAVFKLAWQAASGGRFDDDEVALAFARKLPEFEDVEKDDDDPTVINGLDTVVEALAKKRPSLLRKEGESEERQPSGRPANGPKKSKKAAQDAELLKKYPALRR